MAYRFGILMLALYSVLIIFFELQFGQTYVREYLSDIEGDVIFFAVNTTITTVFLVLIAYNFILCLTLDRKKEKNTKKILPFLVFQSLLFLFLAMDERFMIHERMGYYLGFNDAYLLGAIGVFELVVLFSFKQLLWTKTLKTYSLYLGGLFFGIMILIDAFGGTNTILRLSFEDLSKTWAIFFLFVYSFEFYKLWQKEKNIERI
ncbi:hypothetical protein [Flagellimonas allohymeniacidonis]|uniref:Uncharacterized protein n=1 Tax=Flagellimonas allohymeniacidonis TaxID=2517819 RepID=A0A4Q8QE97_9FLAO|nr:hypothetical protein [Allomuricauda hymeniacidonis]TAI48775.1 hypothetical protein EW142_02955 [Allomuricauda hymeniacidonis]